jgi:hypothetical protein
MMVARLSPILLLVVLWPGSVGGDEFRSPTAECHVTFPGKARKQMTIEERAPTGGWLTVQVQEEEQGTYALSWFDLPPMQRPLTAEALEAVLKRTQADNVSARGYKLLSEGRHDLNDRVPGFELVMERKAQGAEKIRLRTWFVGTRVGARVYQVLVFGQKAWVDSDEATKFLDSFGLNM